MAKGLTSEELIIKNIKITINNIKKVKTSPSIDENDTERRFKRLKPLNDGMHDDLLIEYNRAVLNYVPQVLPASRIATQNGDRSAIY